MNDRERLDDLEEAGRLEAAAEYLAGATREEVSREAAALRAKWPVQEIGKVTVGDREMDLAEADRLSSIACTLRPGEARIAVETEAAALRAKWPDFSDDADGQMDRLSDYLRARGVVASVPARAILARVAELEAEVAEAAQMAGRPCHACGIPQPGAGPGPVNAFLVGACRTFEVDKSFREQVTSGQVQPGQATHPWIPGAPPHKGPQSASSVWSLPILATMLRGDARALTEVGPMLRAALAERGLNIPASGGPQNGHAAKARGSAVSN